MANRFKTSKEDLIDSTTGCDATIDYPHAEIHSGSHYYATHTGTVDDGNELEVRIQTANTTRWPHMEIVVEGTGETDFTLFETTTKTHVAGNSLTAFNRNRNSTNTSGLTVCHTPAGSGDGTQIAKTIFGLDTGGGATRRIAGGGVDSRAEIILKQNEAYLLNVTSGTDGNRITVTLDWYEHTNK